MSASESNPPDLAAILAEFSCQTGTIHHTKPDGVTLELVSQIGVPEALLEKVSSIPFGKGIAGAAAEKKEPIELCNLQVDLGGVAKPAARATGVSGSIAVPVLDADSGKVLGTIGIGKFEPYEFTAPEKVRLGEIAADYARAFGATAR